MAYKLSINNKVSTVSYADARKIRIELGGRESDVMFFKKWQDQCKDAKCKQDYVRTLNFEKITERGQLMNCFPVLGENETEVEIFYDFKHLL